MEEQTLPNKKPVRKWPFVLLAIVLIIGATGYYFYNNYLSSNKWKPLLQKELKDLVLKTTDGLYSIEYSDFDLNLTSGNLTLSDFKLVPDTSVYNKLVTIKKAPDNLFTLSVKKLVIEDVGARRAYKEKILEIKNIAIEKPSLTIVSRRFAYNDTVKVGTPKTPYQLIKNTFKKLRIDSVMLKDISLNYINKNNGTIKHNELKHLDISVSDIVIDSLSSKDTSRFYYTKGVSFTVYDYHVATPDSMYFADIKKIFFSTSQRTIILDNVSFLPRYNRTAFYEKTGEAGDIYSLKFKQIDINDIDLQSFLRKQKLYAGVMNLKGPDIRIYTNDAFKGKKTIKIGKDPHQALQKVALDMRLNQLNIGNGYINYSETDATSGYTGQIIFTHTNAYILNVTNDSLSKVKNPYMTAVIKTRFMNEGPLQVNFKFNLRAKDGAFNYSGELGKFDGKKLDKLVKPLALVHVESADIQKLTFNVNASNYMGKGSLEFYYKNLKVDILKKVEGQKKLQSQGLISLLANGLVIDDDNPDKKGVFRPGPIDLKRDPYVSFFSFLYKGLLDGLKPSVGFSKKTEASVNNAITKVTGIMSDFHKFKEDRKKRREERRKEKQAKKESIKQSKMNKGN